MTAQAAILPSQSFHAKGGKTEERKKERKLEPKLSGFQRVSLPRTVTEQEKAMAVADQSLLQEYISYTVLYKKKKGP